jgi:DNA-binding response OmpR family regulator
MSKANLLVVEDDPLQRKLIRENLEQEGYAVFEAENKQGSLGIITQQPIDIAIVDFKLNGETGLDVIRALLEPSTP